MALPLNHQTPAQFAARFWTRVAEVHERARAGDADAAALRDKLVWRVWAWIQSGDLTSDQVRVSFNNHFNRALTTNQWNQYVNSRLIPMKDRYLAQLAEGEL